MLEVRKLRGLQALAKPKHVVMHPYGEAFAAVFLPLLSLGHDSIG